jgi:hypothetical protein
MWWLVVPVALGAAGAIYSYFKGEEREAREKWQRDRSRVERSIAEHRHNIEQHLAAAQASYNFQLLRDLHHSSFCVADEAYKLKRDADRSLDVMGRMIRDASDRRKTFWGELRDAKGVEKQRIEDEIRLLNELLAAVRPDFGRVLDEKRAFAAELQKFNSQTRTLKEAIRDRCGAGGREWFERLEQRAAQRRRLRPASTRRA